jgi:hypothetical protein
MAIRISRNETGNCINFIGSTNPAYWNACLSAVINSDNSERVDIINDIRSENDADTQYEFYAVSYTDFADRDGNSFASAQAMVDYINTNANVVGVSDVGADLTGVDVNFRLDQTSTSVIMDNGSAFGVNTIKAVADTDGTIHIHAIGAGVPNGSEAANDHKHFEKLEHARVSVNGSAVAGGLNDVVNTLNELFTVGAFESVVIADPYSTMIADVDGVLAGYTLEGTGAVDPAGADIFTNTGTGNYAGLKSTATIDQAGEYFTFDIRDEGQIGFGLVHSQASFDAGTFSGSATYADPTTFAVGNSAHYGFQFSHWFHPTPNGSWTNYGANTGIVYGPGWYSWESQADWLAGNPVKMRVGIDTNGFISIESLQNDDITWVVHARSSYPVVEGAEFHLGVKSANPSARVHSAPKVHLLEPAAPTMYFRYIESPDGNFEYPLFATAEEANYYDLNHSGTVGTGTSHTHVYTDDPTGTSWYMPTTGSVMNATTAPQGTWLTDFGGVTYTEITSQSNSDLAPSSFTIAQQYISENSTLNLQLAPQDVSYTTTIANGPSWLSLSNGYLLQGTAPYVSSATDYTVDVTRTNSYGSTTYTLTVSVADNLSLSAISGLDIAYGNTAAPSSVFSDEEFAGKFQTTIAQGQEISWTHRDYLVGGFLTTGGKSNFNSGSSIADSGNWEVRFSNWQSALMQTFSHGWAVGGSQNVGNLDGATHKMVYKTDGYVEYYLNDVLKYTSASALTGDQDLYLMTPTTYNLTTEIPLDFAVSTTGAGSTDAPSGFTSPLLQGEMGATDILGNGAPSAATSIMTVTNGYRLIITEAWIEQNVLPYMDSDEDKVFLGVPSTGAAWSSITLSDFDMVLRLQQSGTGHKSLLWDNGSNQNETTVSSLTDGYYNYAFEWDGTNLSLIANRVYGDFLTEPSIADGGTFDRVITHSNYSLQSGDLPFVLATNTGGQVKLNPYFLGMSIPAAPTTNLTPWTKALDFSGSSEHAAKVSTFSGSNPLLMDSISQVLAGPSTSGNTANASNARPWATAIVFQPDGNNSNQHIWNSGEGAGSTDDNIYLRVDASGNLYFGWGRSGALNECVIGAGFNAGAGTNQFWGVYIAHNGTRLSGNNATATNLADCFDIRIMNNQGGTWQIAGAGGTFADASGNRSTVTNWSRSGSNTGGRMDRAFTGNFTIGGRGSNRSFHGKVASMVVTTLRLGVAMPTDAEIELMITDPKKVGR